MDPTNTRHFKSRMARYRTNQKNAQSRFAAAPECRSKSEVFSNQIRVFSNQIRVVSAQNTSEYNAITTNARMCKPPTAPPETAKKKIQTLQQTAAKSSLTSRNYSATPSSIWSASCSD